MRLLIHFARYGPYHHARLRAAYEVLAPLGWEVIGLETAGTDATYAWNETKSATDGLRVFTVFPGRIFEEITAAEYRETLRPLLDSLKPDAMAIAGWGTPDARECLSWCRKHVVRRIVMSETRAADGKRVWWKELAKRYLISRFDGALVGGRSHRDYLVSLGMKPERIEFGYNVVDNDYFANKTADFKTEDIRSENRGQETEGSHAQDPNFQYPISNIHSTYFLASNRFIERKNLLRLIEAYASYVQKSKINNHQSSIWSLCLLGDGVQKPTLIDLCHQLGLNVIESAPWEATEKAESGKQKAEMDERDANSLSQLSEFQLSAFTSPTVFFPGFRQIDELPRFYAHAGCFIHPAFEEPWGLVINEAMACGLPILSSNNVGAAEQLVDDGVNGWKFDPENVGEIAELMHRISAFDFEHSAFGAASRGILEERCPTRAFGQGLDRLLG